MERNFYRYGMVLIFVLIIFLPGCGMMPAKTKLADERNPIALPNPAPSRAGFRDKWLSEPGAKPPEKGFAIGPAEIPGKKDPNYGIKLEFSF